jgi:hypothetical protein
MAPAAAAPDWLEVAELGVPGAWGGGGGGRAPLLLVLLLVAPWERGWPLLAELSHPGPPPAAAAGNCMHDMCTTHAMSQQ